MTVSKYEELLGGLGRAIHYRPTRFRVQELLRDYPPRLLVDEVAYGLHDFAMSGIAYAVPAGGREFSPGEEVGIDLRLGERPIYSGRGRVARVEKSRSRSHVAVRLLTGFVNVPTLIDSHEELALSHQLNDGWRHLREQIPEAYRLAMEPMAHFILYHRAELAKHERRIRGRGGDVSGEIHKLASKTVEAIRPRWRQLRDRCADAAHPHLADGAAVRAMKQYSEQLLTCNMIEGPLVRRAFEKPLGYAGDYQTLMYIYRNELEGESVSARIFHKFCAEEDLAEGVRRRRDMVTEMTRREHRAAMARDGAFTDFRAMSVGCGPAMEVRKYIEEEKGGWEGKVLWHLVDQEERALSLAYTGVYQRLAESGGAGSVQCMYVTFKKLITDPDMAFSEGPYDFIYSAGFFDYLPERVAKGLVTTLVAHLKPGGLLAVGNARADRRHFWCTAFVVDWDLLYRSRDEVLALADPVAHIADADVLLEPAGAYYFLMLRKKRISGQ